MKELDQALENLITKQAFSLEAVKRIEEIREENKTLTTTNKALSDEIINKSSQINRLQSENSGINDELQSHKDREAALIVREHAISRLELTAEFAELRRLDTRELALSMTRNTHLRESFFEDKVLTNTGSDGSSYQMTQPSTTITDKEEL